MSQRTYTIEQRVVAEGKRISFTSGPGVYGHVVLELEPSDDDGIAFEWCVDESEVPRAYESAVYEGVNDTFAEGGALEGKRLVGVRVRVVGGSFHEVDSAPRFYAIAASLAFLDGVQRAGLREVGL